MRLDDINYEKISKIINACGSSSLLATFLCLSTSNNIDEKTFGSIAALCFVSNGIINNNYNTSELLKIKKLYETFIDKYAKLNNDFSLENPLEIYTFYYNLLYSGYLSVNHNYEYEDESFLKVEDYYNLIGTKVVTGKSCCRNTSSMLRDIYIKLGMLSGILATYNFNNHKEEIEKIKDENTVNHAIVYVNYKNKSYFLDPSNISIFRPTIVDNTILYDDKYQSMTRVKIESTKYFNDKIKSMKIKRKLNKNIITPSYGEELEIVSKTEKIFSNNLDIIEKFYNNTKPLYEEISSKVLKYK